MGSALCFVSLIWSLSTLLLVVCVVMCALFVTFLVFLCSVLVVVLPIVRFSFYLCFSPHFLVPSVNYFSTINLVAPLVNASGIHPSSFI